LGQFSKNYRTFTQKSSQKYGFGIRYRDHGSGNTYSRSRILDPGVKKVPDPGSATLLKTDILVTTVPLLYYPELEEELDEVDLLMADGLAERDVAEASPVLVVLN
jgi:hypothetical protein